MNKNIKIFMIIPELRHGGTEKFILNLLNELSNKYLIVLCCIGSSNSEFKKYYENKNIVIITLNSSIQNCFFKLLKLMKKHKPDVVFSNLWALNIISALCKILFFFKFKLIISEGNPYTKLINYKIPFFLIKFLVSLTYLIADKIITASSKGLLIHINNFSLFNIKKKSLYINNGIEINNQIYKNKNFSSGIIKILCITQFRDQKDIETIFKAIWLLSKDFKCFFTLVGDGKNKNRLLKYASNLGIEKFIKFEGNQNDLSHYYKEHEYFVFSSFFEGGPNVILEALNHDIKIVASDCNYGPKEYLNNGEYGYLFKIGDYRNIKDIIVTNLNKKIDLEKRRRWISQFDRKITVQKYISLIDSITIH